MDSLVFNLRSASTTVQALAVTVGGLVGVFATLAAFFLIIWMSVKFGNRKA